MNERQINSLYFYALIFLGVLLFRNFNVNDVLCIWILMLFSFSLGRDYPHLNDKIKKKEVVHEQR
jgi:hypothetical protein